MITENDVISCPLTPTQIKECIKTSLNLMENIIDRADLHERSTLERFFDILMGEISEQSVIAWLNKQGKHAVSAVDKISSNPDLGHDIILHNSQGEERQCSVKSSVSVKKDSVVSILSVFNLASKSSEIRDVNIQCVFWLSPDSTPRINVLSEKNFAIVGWEGINTLKEIHTKQYRGESREVVQVPLKDLRPMSELLQYLS